MPDGVLIRELPDGGHEFVLDDPVLEGLIVDRRVTLRFGPTDVVLSAPFRLQVDGVDHRLDPRFPDSLAPLLACIPGTARWLWASPCGALHLVLMQGQRLVVPELDARSTWSVGTVDGPAGRST
ncbi:MAG: DUF6188 family protein [Acidimicrobiales bacterium]